MENPPTTTSTLPTPLPLSPSEIRAKLIPARHELISGSDNHAFHKGLNVFNTFNSLNVLRTLTAWDEYALMGECYRSSMTNDGGNLFHLLVLQISKMRANYLHTASNLFVAMINHTPEISKLFMSHKDANGHSPMYLLFAHCLHDAIDQLDACESYKELVHAILECHSTGRSPIIDAVITMSERKLATETTLEMIRRTFLRFKDDKDATRIFTQIESEFSLSPLFCAVIFNNVPMARFLLEDINLPIGTTHSAEKSVIPLFCANYLCGIDVFAHFTEMYPYANVADIYGHTVEYYLKSRMYDSSNLEICRLKFAKVYNDSLAKMNRRIALDAFRKNLKDIEERIQRKRNKARREGNDESQVNTGVPLEVSLMVSREVAVLANAPPDTSDVDSHEMATALLRGLMNIMRNENYTGVAANETDPEPIDHSNHTKLTLLVKGMMHDTQNPTPRERAMMELAHHIDFAPRVNHDDDFPIMSTAFRHHPETNRATLILQFQCADITKCYVPRLTINIIPTKTDMNILNGFKGVSIVYDWERYCYLSGVFDNSHLPGAQLGGLSRMTQEEVLSNISSVDPVLLHVFPTVPEDDNWEITVTPHISISKQDHNIADTNDLGIDQLRKIIDNMKHNEENADEQSQKQLEDALESMNLNNKNSNSDASSNVERKTGPSVITRTYLIPCLTLCVDIVDRTAHKKLIETKLNAKVAFEATLKNTSFI